MPSTASGIVYPSSVDSVDVAGDMKRLADSVQAALTAQALAGENRPRVYAWDSVGNSCLDATNKLIAWDQNLYDNNVFHDTAFSFARIIFNTPGLYDISILLTYPTAIYTGTSNMNVRKNAGGSGVGGTSVKTHYFNDSGSATANVQEDFFMVMAAGDYLEVFVNQQSGATRVNTASSTSSRVIATYVASS